MKRCCFVLVLLLVLVQFLTFSVFAADDDSGSIGGFFSNVVETLVNLGKFIRDGIFSGVEYILSGLKALFIPKDDYFSRFQDRLYNAFQKKFGSVLSVANYLKTRFSNLRAYSGDLLVVKFPKNHFFSGVNLDLLSGAGGIADMVRGALSGFVVLCTIAFAYKKVSSMINT